MLLPLNVTFDQSVMTVHRDALGCMAHTSMNARARPLHALHAHSALSWTY